MSNASRLLTASAAVAIGICLVATPDRSPRPAAALEIPQRSLSLEQAGGAAPDPPANDNFSGAITIEALPFSDAIDTSAATAEADEPRPLCGGGLATVWYRFTPAADVLLVADAQGSDFSTALAVWTQGPAGPELVSCSNTFSLPYSRFAFEARGGQTYFFQAGGFLDPAGILLFHLYAGVSPANDDFESAASVPALPFSDSLDTLTATTEVAEPDPGCGLGGVAATVWYTFTASQDGILVASLGEGEFFHPVVAVYHAAAGGELASMGCSYPVVRHGRVGVRASAGETYLFQVGTSKAFEGLTPAIFITGKFEFSLRSLPIPSCPLAQFSVRDPAGDLLPYSGQGPDVISVGGAADADNFCVTVEFAEGVERPDAGTDRATFAWLRVDTDQDRDTGYGSGPDFYCEGDDGLGVDATVSVSGGSGVLVPSLSPGAPDSVAFFEDTSLTLIVPLELVGDGPPLAFGLLVGPSPPPLEIAALAPSDCVPDRGAIYWPAEAGDVRCDGRVDSADAALVLQFHAALISALPCQDAADVDGNGDIDSRDAALILRRHAGLVQRLTA